MLYKEDNSEELKTGKNQLILELLHTELVLIQFQSVWTELLASSYEMWTFFTLPRVWLRILPWLSYVDPNANLSEGTMVYSN